MRSVKWKSGYGRCKMASHYWDSDTRTGLVLSRRAGQGRPETTLSADGIFVLPEQRSEMGQRRVMAAGCWGCNEECHMERVYMGIEKGRGRKGMRRQDRLTVRRDGIAVRNPKQI